MKRLFYRVAAYLALGISSLASSAAACLHPRLKDAENGLDDSGGAAARTLQVPDSCSASAVALELPPAPDNADPSGGFVTDLPYTATALELIGELRLARTDLESVRESLRTSLAEGRIDGGDLALAVILPGGSLYLAAKQASTLHAEERLADVEGTLLVLDDDIGHFMLAALRESSVEILARSN